MMIIFEEIDIDTTTTKKQLEQKLQGWKQLQNLYKEIPNYLDTFITNNAINSASKIVLENFWVKLESGLLLCKFPGCHRTTREEIQIQKHVLTHVSERALNRFDRGLDYLLCMTGTEISDPVICSSCAASIPNIEMGRAHLENHASEIITKERLRKCNVCNKVFKRSESFDHHAKFVCGSNQMNN